MLIWHFEFESTLNDGDADYHLYNIEHMLLEYLEEISNFAYILNISF